MDLSLNLNIKCSAYLTLKLEGFLPFFKPTAELTMDGRHFFCLIYFTVLLDGNIVNAV